MTKPPFIPRHFPLYRNTSKKQTAAVSPLTPRRASIVSGFFHESGFIPRLGLNLILPEPYGFLAVAVAVEHGAFFEVFNLALEVITRSVFAEVVTGLLLVTMFAGFSICHGVSPSGKRIPSVYILH